MGLRREDFDEDQIESTKTTVSHNVDKDDNERYKISIKYTLQNGDVIRDSFSPVPPFDLPLPPPPPPEDSLNASHQGTKYAFRSSQSLSSSSYDLPPPIVDTMRSSRDLSSFDEAPLPPPPLKPVQNDLMMGGRKRSENYQKRAEEIKARKELQKAKPTPQLTEGTQKDSKQEKKTEVKTEKELKNKSEKLQKASSTPQSDDQSKRKGFRGLVSFFKKRANNASGTNIPSKPKDLKGKGI